MPALPTMITRNNGSDPLVPEPVSAQVIQELPTQSAILQRAKSVQLSSKTERLPVLDTLPQAYWVNGDTGLKATTNQEWKNVTLVVEELAAIVPIPEAYLDDSQVPIWDEVRPRLTEACGKLIDEAALFGVNKPATWSTSIFDAACAAGNFVTVGDPSDYVFEADGTTPRAADLGELVTQLGDKMSSNQGYAVNGFVGRPGINWKLAGLRNSQGTPIFQPNMDGTPGGNLYGYKLSEVNNGSYDASKAQLIAGDWSKAIVGLRQDISFKVFTEGVISDNNGAVVLNLMQNDSIALRVVMRLAFATANPVTELNSGAADSARYAFGAVRTLGGGS